MIIWRMRSPSCAPSFGAGFRRTGSLACPLPSIDRQGCLSYQRSLMHDELKEEAIVNKVGGRFKLSTLIQKRMVALNTGARPLVDVKGGDKMAIVIQEILQDKIFLDNSGQVQMRGA